MRLEDHTGKFSEAELQELVNFICNDLLSTEIDTEWLDVIRIRKDDRSGYRGYWKFKLRFDTQNQIDGIVAVVVLNYYYVRTLDALKEVLAHEYGHHWTLSHLLVNQRIIDVWKERIPIEYYQLRGLNNQAHAHDYSKGWHCCDKEIIAEDYRVLFAPKPYNENHRMVVNFDSPLVQPNQEIKKYIESLQTP
ncbi:hypothetical protein NDI37_02635 [Funiculus sociatus GB2-A5]|uniref:SprT-like domain-containing protein n=1 Tax=Funiculus sociatus GB2-A5 TaxID=2933946 RepID=A0ABV0JL13_9CYAN|nr:MULTISPECIES: hypothetical protein [unclassified Trichocoleus]MBD1904697.1 hypothetical protein [Trichocoleus sp. FACHB-832]MBD2062495.1 hypothetical protein [Trichocoleus sp. FACHB-6]